MFTTPKVGCYLQSFTGKGDAENKEMKMTFYITPISYELAFEISPQVADRIFRRSGREWYPAQEMPKASFSLGAIPAQNLRIYPHADEALDSTGVFVPSAKISGIQAQRPYADKEFFRLEFDATVTLNRTTLELIDKYFHALCFISMEPAQEELFDDKKTKEMDLLCRLCGHHFDLHCDPELNTDHRQPCKTCDCPGFQPRGDGYRDGRDHD